jgi:hypothetical protein
MAKITHQQVADFLSSFRELKIEDQQASAVWQELAAFPQWWGDAPKVAGKKARPTQAPPDPRLPAAQRAQIAKDQAATTDDGKGKTVAQPGAMTAKGMPVQNPWSDYKEPAPGPCLLGVPTDVPPPFSGSWARTPNGWYRSA